MRTAQQSARQALSRMASVALTLWFLASAVFLLLRLVPGDPAALILGDLADASSRALLRARLHLDEPLWAQYCRFLRELATLDFGWSLRHPGLSARALVLQVMPATAELAGLAVLLGSAGGLVAAVLSVGPWLSSRRDYVHLLAIVLSATPLLAVAPIATYVLAVRTRLVPLPGDPEAGVRGLLFASTLLALPLGAHVARVGRAALLDLGRARFLTTAQAKGASPLRVWVLHALPVACAPLVAVVGTQLGALLGGAVILERLFERPGLGTLILEAYASRDVPVLQAALIASGALFVGIQALALTVHAALDPRVGP